MWERIGYSIPYKAPLGITGVPQYIWWDLSSSERSNSFSVSQNLYLEHRPGEAGPRLSQNSLKSTRWQGGQKPGTASSVASPDEFCWSVVCPPTLWTPRKLLCVEQHFSVHLVKIAFLFIDWQNTLFIKPFGFPLKINWRKDPKWKLKL